MLILQDSSICRCELWEQLRPCIWGNIVGEVGDVDESEIARQLHGTEFKSSDNARQLWPLVQALFCDFAQRAHGNAAMER